MNKSELRNGMMVKLNTGDWYVVLKDVLIGGKGNIDALININGGWMHMDKYLDNLDFIGDKMWNVDKVVQHQYFADVIWQLTDGKTPDTMDRIEILWQRENPRITEAKTRVAELQSNLSDAQSSLYGAQIALKVLEGLQ